MLMKSSLAMKGWRIGCWNSMRLIICLFILLVARSAYSQSVSVPFRLDHNRIIIDVSVRGVEGIPEKVDAWLDNGNPDLWLTERLAQKLGFQYTSEPRVGGLDGTQVRMAMPAGEIMVGGLRLPLTGMKQAQVSLSDRIAPGLSAAINLPSSLLRDYDVIVDFPKRQLTLATPGNLEFKGKSSQVFINEENGLIQVPGKIGDEPCNLGLDVGASISFLSSETCNKLANVNPAWPRMTGGVAAANLWGLSDEPQWNILRLGELQLGPVPLSGVAVVSLPPEVMHWISERAGIATAGLIGSNALLNYRVGLSYSKKTIYFEQTADQLPPDMDVVGLVLRPERDGRYTILGLPVYDGQSAVPEVKAGDVLIEVDGVPVKGLTMGKTWSLLRGNPGDFHSLILEREGKRFTVKATVRRFLKPNPPE